MSLQPTFTGFVASTTDALLLFQAASNGTLPQVTRRPHDRERPDLIRSGAIFIFNENQSGIKRWTDGVNWSPSRILGNFLIYRQLDKAFPPGEKKRTVRRGRKRSSPFESGAGPHPYQRPLSPPDPRLQVASSDRALVGSLIDSYGFKMDGLVKKTMSVCINNENHHLVSYYRPVDAANHELITPSESPFLKDIKICDELLHKQNFRVPLDSAHETQMAHPFAGFQSRPLPGQEMPYQVKYELSDGSNPDMTPDGDFRFQGTRQQYLSGLRPFTPNHAVPQNQPVLPPTSGGNVSGYHEYYHASSGPLPPPPTSSLYQFPGQHGATCLPQPTARRGSLSSLPPLAQPSMTPPHGQQPQQTQQQLLLQQPSTPSHHGQQGPQAYNYGPYPSSQDFQVGAADPRRLPSSNSSATSRSPKYQQPPSVMANNQQPVSVYGYNNGTPAYGYGQVNGW